MKKSPSLLFLISFLSFSVFGQNWQYRASLPTAAEARHHPITFSIDGFGYLVTGSAANNFLDDMYRYDPQSNTWEQMNDFSGPARAFGYGAAYDGKAYVGFGLDGSYEPLNDLWEYDPTTDSWTQLASMPTYGRYHPAMITLNGKIYVGTGENTTEPTLSEYDLDDWWEYDIATDTWTQKADFIGPAVHHPFFFTDGQYAYVCFGHSVLQSTVYNTVYRYDPENDSWTQMNNMPASGRVAGTQFNFGSRGYVLSGENSSHVPFSTGEFWQYNPVNDSWTELNPHFGGSRWAPGSFVIDNKAYLVAGSTGHGVQEQRTKSMQVVDLAQFADLSEVDAELTVVYPNPSEGELVINTNEFEPGANYEIVNGEGRLILRGNLTSTKTEINVDAEPGVYFVNLSNDQKSSRHKIMLL